jgi:hypothetical protein
VHAPWDKDVTSANGEVSILEAQILGLDEAYAAVTITRAPGI